MSTPEIVLVDDKRNKRNRTLQSYTSEINVETEEVRQRVAHQAERRLCPSFGSACVQSTQSQLDALSVIGDYCSLSFTEIIDLPNYPSQMCHLKDPEGINNDDKR